VVWPLVFYSVTVALVTSGPNFHHFTWVSILSLGAYSALACVGVEQYFFWTFMSIQAKVIFGVIVMSAAQCGVFERAYESNGALGFILGNFAMHYLPALLAMFMARREHVYCGAVRAFGQAWTSLAIFLCWMYHDKPMDVYNCRMSSSLGFVGILIIMLATKSVIVHLHP